ncbi:MAG: VIT domain-containing protein, partial [Proteobacteria bacterium]|nr:VIT domain-containing protein [Pseudomonadota bacterium]
LLPLVAMDVDVRVTGIIAAIELAQTFVNTTSGAIEATYLFPLPDRAAVHRFRMEIGTRVIEGVIDERGAAREQYEEAIAAGHRAAITEEERPGVFTMRVGNLMPGEAATVRLSLVGPLPVDDGEITFRFPLVVAPRYIPGHALGGEQAGLGVAADTNLVPDASRISPPVLLPGCPNPVRLGLRVAITDGNLVDLASSLHAVTLANRDARVVEVQPGERLDRDFILRWRIAGKELVSSLACADDADGNGGTFLLTFVPPSTTTVGAKPRDVVFVIDRSGSMGGWKMVAARRAAARMIDTLTSRDRFSAMAFDNVVDVLPEPGLVAATDRNRYRAVEALGKVEARGGTELMEPLRRALSVLAGGTDDRERVLVLVTDGQVGNEDQILLELAPHVKNVRMFTLGIDQAVNAAFLRRLAGVGGGLCELVESEDRLDVVMAKVHRRIGLPIATELALHGSNLELDVASLAPRKLPDVYVGAPVAILGRYRGKVADRANVAVEVTGTSLGDPMKLRVERLPVHAATSAWLGASWARAHLRDLEDQYAAGVSSALEQQIVAVSKRYSVLSRFTAFLAVDRQEIVNPGGRLTQAVQPVEAPAAWEQQRSGSMRGHASAPMAPPSPPSRTMMPAQASAAPMAPMPMDKKVMSAPGRMPYSGPSQPAPAAAAPPPPPMGAASPRGGGVRREERAKEPAAPEPMARAKLGALARELEAQVHGRNDAASIRVLRQRLTEWVEDVRSVGADAALATEVERLVARITAALQAHDAAEYLAVALALAALAAGTPPADAPKKGRQGFWK